MCSFGHSLLLLAICFHPLNATCSKMCYCSESENGGKTVRCSQLQLTEVPKDIPNDTQRLYLDFNLLTTVPSNTFRELLLLRELDLSNNQLALLEPGAFEGLAGSLRLLDLSSNKLMNFNLEAFAGVQAWTNLTHNPWHCDCNLQSILPYIQLDPASLAGLVCNTSETNDLGAQGKSFILTKGLDLCVVSKSTDVAMLVTMFGWFAMVISYLVYYVRHNQEDARRHLENLKSLPQKHRKSEESLTVSTVV